MPWALVVWVGLICFAVVPWWSYQDHAHWARVRWVPFVSPPIRARDLIVNLLMYVPLGWWGSRVGRGTTLGRVVLGAALLSCATEFSQVFSHGRYPSLTDVVCNVAGALVGGALFAARRATLSA